MNKFKSSLLIGSLLVIAIVLAACGSQDDSGEGGSSSGSSTLAVGGAGDTSWVYGALTTISETIKSDEDTNIDLVVQTTPGSVPHPQLYDEGQIDLGSSTTSVDVWATEGREEFYDKSYEGVYNSVLPLNKAKLHIVVPADSDIEEIRDLEGKSVFTGDPGTSILYTTRDILGALDIEVDDHSMDRDQAFEYLKEGRLDALMFTLGAPYSSLLELDASMDIKLVPVPEEDVEILEEELPDIKGITFEADDEYDFVEEEIQTVSNIQLLSASADVSDDEIYDIVKATWESWDKINEQVPATKLVSEEDILDMVVPIHPGAIKYYEEIGIDIPEELTP